MANRMAAMPPFESRAGDAGRVACRGALTRAGSHLLLLLLAFALMLSATVAAGASAAVVSSGGFKYVTKDFTLQPGGARTKKAPCPKQTHVLSGGHYNSGGFGDVIGAHAYPYDGDDRGKAPDDGWKAQLRAIGASVPASVHAICTRRVFPEYPKVTDTVIPDGLEDLTQVDCDPVSLEATGGGSRGPAFVREVETWSGGEDWTVGLANHGQAEKEVTVYAVCAEVPQMTFADDSPTVAANEDQQTLTEAECHPSTPHVVGGGFLSNGSDTLQGLAVIAATRPGQNLSSWRVWMDNHGETNPNIFARAVCSAPL
jgi:hypothetical protein